MDRITLSVPDITCGHCKASIEGAVKEMAGIESVDVTVDTKKVDVAFDAAKTSAAAITQTIEEQGFEVAG